MRGFVFCFRLVLAGLMMAGFVPAGPSFAAAPMQSGQAPGFYRMHVGRFEVTALLDGTHPFPAERLAVGAQPGEVAALLGAQFLTAPVEGMINAFMVNTGDRLIMIDTGAGNLYGKEGGGLGQAIRQAGYDPAQVDDVFLTHLHEDHVGGLLYDGRMVFPNADIHVSRIEADFWLDSAHKDQVNPLLAPFFAAAQQVLAPYIAAGRLKTFSDAVPLLPGLTPVFAPGHTPGHCFYLLRDGADAMLFWGDTVHVQPVQLADPNVAIAYDWNVPQAINSRKQAFADAARGGYWVAAAHISFPGIGHVRDLGAGRFAWVPANYTLNK